VLSWSALKFILALSLVLLLFVAGALIIPKPSDESDWNAWERFIENGRWSLLALSVYCLLAFIANPTFFGIAYFTSANLANLLLAGAFGGTFFLRAKRHWAWATVAIALVSAYEIVRLSPSTYP
jgi:hypothetical protein